MKMDNLKYLENMKRGSYRENVEHSEYERRQVLALEIIAEELCKYNKGLDEWKKELEEANKLVEECNKGG